MRGALAYLGRHAGVALAAGVLVGIVLPSLARWAAPLLLPSIVVLLVFSLMRLRLSEVLAVLGQPAATTMVLVWLLLAAPVTALGLVAIATPPPALATAIVLASASAPVFSTIAFALMFRLDAALATVVVVASIFIMPATLPPLALLLLGLDLKIDLVDFMLRLAALVGGSLALALCVRAAVPLPRLERHGEILDGLNVVGLLVFAIAIMDGVTDTLLARPAYVGLTLGASFAANLLLQLAGGALFWRLGRRAALTVAIASGNRNMGLLLAALGASADRDVALYLAIAQVPIYLVPLCRPAYERLSGGRPGRSSISS
jgi:BASS family bile acid:Na+ symporter